MLSSLTKLEELNLAGNKLGGTIPADVAVFSNLKALDLSSMDLDGEICMSQQTRVLCLLTLFFLCAGGLPKELGKLVNLKELVLHTNGFTGTIVCPIVHNSKCI